MRESRGHCMKPLAGGLGAVALAFLAVGLYLGLGSVTKDGFACGSGLGGLTSSIAKLDSDELQREITNNVADASLSGQFPSTPESLTPVSDVCRPALSDRKTLSIAILIPGGVLLLAAGISALSDNQHREQTSQLRQTPIRQSGWGTGSNDGRTGNSGSDDVLAELDRLSARYKAGRITGPDYRRQRTALRAKLQEFGG